MTDLKKRNATAAGLLSLVISGLGQLYNAQPRKALSFLVLTLLLPVALFSTPLSVTPIGALILLFCIVGFKIFVVADAVAQRSATR